MRVLKVKVGKDFAREKAQITQIRQQYPEMDLYADANQCYSADDARSTLRELAEIGHSVVRGTAAHTADSPARRPAQRCDHAADRR